MLSTAAVQLPKRASRAKPWLTVGKPSDLVMEDEGTERLTLDIPESMYRWLDRLAAYRNALAIAQGKTLKPKWSRKSLSEAFLRDRVMEYREQIREMLEACGDLPPSDDKAAMRDYVAKVLAWSGRREGK